MATWPLPDNTVQYFTIVYTWHDQRAVFETDLGRPKTAALASDAQEIIAFDVIFTGHQMKTFRDWWEADLALGTRTFTGLEGVVEHVAAELQFKSIPRFVQIRSGLAPDRRWRATFELWVV